MNKKQEEILKSLYEMDEDVLLNQITNFEILCIENETRKDFYFWPNYSHMSEYFELSGLDTTHLYMVGVSDEPFRKLHQIYNHALYLKHQVLERLHYDYIMSYLSEFISWCNDNKRKIIHKEVNNFFLEKKIRIRHETQIKQIFYMQAKEMSKNVLHRIGKYNSDNDPYVLDYLKDIKPFNNPKNKTRYKFKDKIYHRKNFVLEFAKEYISQNPNATLESLNKTFRVNNKWGWSFAFFYPYDNIVQNGLQNHSFFDDPITLKNGEIIVVIHCSDYFIVNGLKDKAIECGYNIETIE